MIFAGIGIGTVVGIATVIGVVATVIFGVAAGAAGLFSAKRAGGTIALLKTNNEALKDRVTELERENRELHATNLQLSTRITALGEKVADLGRMVSGTDAINKLQLSLQDQHTQILAAQEKHHAETLLAITTLKQTGAT